MILGLLGLIVPIIPTVFLGYLKEKGKVNNMIFESEMARRDAIVQIRLAQYQHWIAWLPVFLIEMSVASYIIAVFGTSILQIPEYGPLKMPQDFIWVMMTVIGSMFFTRVTKSWFK